VGGSAGGLDAYTRLLRHLPADMGVAIVIVNHLRTVATLLHEILPRYTEMPVELITERLLIEPNHVFIIPEQRDLHVLDGEFRLKPISKPRGWPDVITVFLRSLTEHWDGKLIAVIVSGYDGDGAAALCGIKEVGGITIAQKPDTAGQPDMPESAIASGCIDFVLSPEDIAQEIVRIAALKKTAPPLQVVVSGSGRMDLTRAIFRTPGIRTLIVTTQAGRDLLAASGVGSLVSTEVRSLEGPIIAPASMLELLRAQFGVSLLLLEGGPTLFGRFVADGCVDELFLTIAPQVAGRNMPPLRPGFIAGVEFLPETAPWLDIVSVKERGNHLYLRYSAATPNLGCGCLAAVNQRGRRFPDLRISYELAGDLFEPLRQINILL
jgi:two-component system chemotaxis response regulator CheB